MSYSLALCVTFHFMLIVAPGSMENIPPTPVEDNTPTNPELDIPPLSIADIMRGVKVPPPLRRHNYDAPDELTIYYQGFRSHGPLGGINKYADAIRQDPINRKTPFSEIKTDSDPNHKDFDRLIGLNEIETFSDAGNKNPTPLQQRFNENRTVNDLNHKNVLTQLSTDDVSTNNADPENVTFENRSAGMLPASQHDKFQTGSMLPASQHDKFQTGSLLRTRSALFGRADAEPVRSPGADLAQADDVGPLRSQRERRTAKGKGKRKKGKKRKGKQRKGKKRKKNKG